MMNNTNSSSSSSPAHSSISSTTTAMIGLGSTNLAATFEDLHSLSALIFIQDCKDDAFQALKSDLMAALDKEVKSLDDDNWMFDGPRSRINLISRPGGFLNKNKEITSHRDLAP
ncbi:hypothetical protein RJ641_035112 [Dillenia turbinata]|uniref:Uncharacterized protein n=1 Tax=Dillenia turbinata TaxID=194707 RepID=A0AAN8VSJ8_9MAGN